MQIVKADFDIWREPLRRPFAFKSGQFTEKWLTRTIFSDSEGRQVRAPGSLAVLWAEPRVFSAHSETGGNLQMATVAEYAAQAACGYRVNHPFDLHDAIFPQVHAYAQQVTGLADLRPTFTLNTMVSADNAAWLLYADVTGAQALEDWVPVEDAPLFQNLQPRIARIPAITYSMPLDEIGRLVDDEFFIFKIKLGKGKTPDEMIQQDLDRLQVIFKAFGERETPWTESGRLAYFLDINGCYPDLPTLQRLLDGMEKIGMLQDVLLIEEPFPEEADIDVSGLPVRIGADESIHGEGDVRRRLDQGFRGVALKPAGKTLTQSLRMAREAMRSDVACYVADSACVPLLFTWNLNLAARIGNFPGLKVGAVESNGPDFYTNWDRLMQEHPRAGARWLQSIQGMYLPDKEFYQTGGGILDGIFA